MLDFRIGALRRGSSLGDWALREALAMNDVAAAWQRTEAAHGMPTDDAVATGGICTQSSSSGMSSSGDGGSWMSVCAGRAKDERPADAITTAVLRLSSARRPLRPIDRNLGSPRSSSPREVTAVLLPRHEMPTGSAGYWPCAADTSSISSPLPADVPACELRARPCELVTDAYWGLKMDELRSLCLARGIKRSGESWKACIPYRQPRTYI